MKKKQNIHFCLRLWFFTVSIILLASAGRAQTIETVIPSDSFLYLKLQNLEACQEVIEASESWKTAANIITDSYEWQPIHQLIQTLPAFLGTDLQGVLETILGDGMALTVSPGAEGLLIGLVIQNPGKTQDAEQVLSKLIRTLAEMGNEVNISQGDYRNIHYHTVQIKEQEVSYGTVGDFFIIGNPFNSFKKMVDVYKHQEASIAGNDKYLSFVESYRKSDIFAFVDISIAYPYLRVFLPTAVTHGLKEFQALGFSWELLSTGGGLRLFGLLKDGADTSLISRHKTEKPLQTERGVSGTEEIFLALSPSMAPIFWQTFFGDFSDEYGGFLLPPATDLPTAFAGELTLSMNFSNFFMMTVKNSHDLRYIVDKPDGTHIESVNIDFPEVNVGILIKPDTPEEMERVFSEFLEKTHMPERRQQFDYKGITMKIDSIPGKLYYGNIHDFFLLAFSAEQFHMMVDNLLDETRTDDLQKRLKFIDAQPAGVLQFNLGPIISALVGSIQWMTSKAAKPTNQIGAHLVSFVVQEKSASLEITHAPDEKGIEVMAKLAPFLFLLITHLQ